MTSPSSDASLKVRLHLTLIAGNISPSVGQKSLDCLHTDRSSRHLSHGYVYDTSGLAKISDKCTTRLHHTLISGNISQVSDRKSLDCFSCPFYLLSVMKVSKRKIAASVITLKMAQKKIKRSVWVREWILRREEFGAHSQLMSELSIDDPGQISNVLRMKPADFEKLACKIGPLISKQDTKFRKSISVTERLAVTLRFLASGDSYTSLSYLFRIPKCTISLIVPEVCSSIMSALKEDYTKAPSTSNEWQSVSNKFELMWNFPKCLGAIDGKHVVIQAPQKSGSFYFNYKGQFSVVLMAIVDAAYKFLIVTVGSNGKVTDGGVFRDSGVADYIETAATGLEKTPLPGRRVCVPHVFVANDAFSLQPHIMKPYPFNCQGSMRIYNYRLSRARRVVENAFGIMSSVFRVLRKPLLLAPERVELLVMATCTLRNWLLSEKCSANVYAPEGTFDSENLGTGEIIHGSWLNENVPVDNLLPLAQQGSNNYSKNAKEVREEYREYFVSSQGEVPWQYTLM